MKRLLLWAVAVLLPLGAISQEVVVTATPPAYLEFQHQPFLVNGVMSGPLREVFQTLGWTIRPNGKEITLSKPDEDEIVLDLGYLPVNEDEKRLSRCFFQITDTIGHGKVTFVPLRYIAALLGEPINLSGNLLTIGTKTWLVDQKLIVIDRGEQHIYAFEGLKQVFECRTCTGRPGFTTTTGIFQIYKKIRGKHEVVGKPWGGIMYNPLYFNGCTAMHGSTEMRKKPSSHGCCRLYYKDADWLYPWTPIGTPVYVRP